MWTKVRTCVVDEDVDALWVELEDFRHHAIDVLRVPQVSRNVVHFGSAAQRNCLNQWSGSGILHEQRMMGEELVMLKLGWTN